MSTQARDVVLVHRGFVDGSGRQGAYDALKRDGYHVSIVQNPTLSNEVATSRGTGISNRPGRTGRHGGSPRTGRAAPGVPGQWSP